MGIARDKRTGQTWMWPLEEEIDSNEEFGMAPDDLGDAFVPYRDSDGRRKTVEDMVEETSEANRKLGYCPTWVGRPPGDWNTVSTDTRRIGSKSSTGVTLNAPSTRN